MLCEVRSLGLSGISGYEVRAECDLSAGLPAFEIVGLPDAAVKEARDRVRAAIKNCGFTFPVSRITVNLAPANQRKGGTVYDLPILAGILAAGGQLRLDGPDSAYVGELSLSGSLRPVVGMLPMALAVTGIICSIIGSFLVKTKEDATQESLLRSLRTGTYTAAVLAAIVAAPLTYVCLLYTSDAADE